MANKKFQGSKSKAAKSPVTVGSLWLAGVGAVSLTRKHGEVLLGDLIDEGRRLQGQAATFMHETNIDARAQVAGLVTPLRARFKQRIEQTGAMVQAGTGAVLSRLGIPTKADIDDLAQRVGALTRQLKTSK
jgi:poly(hydroxyalkanoate) granule-associated protein